MRYLAALPLKTRETVEIEHPERSAMLTRVFFSLLYFQFTHDKYMKNIEKENKNGKIILEVSKK